MAGNRKLSQAISSYRNLALFGKGGQSAIQPLDGVSPSEDCSNGSSPSGFGLWPSAIRDNPHRRSNLQTMRFIKACFWPEKEGVLQKNGGPTENILHFFSRFSDLLGFCPLQAIAFQQQAAIQPLQKKSYQKHYRRFFVCSAICHNRRMNDEQFIVCNPEDFRGCVPCGVKRQLKFTTDDN
jgi:hypothetical protein